jgi:hypothetical protein
MIGHGSGPDVGLLVCGRLQTLLGNLFCLRWPSSASMLGIDAKGGPFCEMAINMFGQPTRNILRTP